ncbi:hypothetical protein [Catellatospora citrea]|nr:hypothetical protein [Catellatospora citrea]
MEFVVGLFVVTAVLIAVMLLVVARRGRSRSMLDPSRDTYQGFPHHQHPESSAGLFEGGDVSGGGPQ